MGPEGRTTRYCRKCRVETLRYNDKHHHCIPCRKAYSARWRKKNQKYIKEYQTMWCKENQKTLKTLSAVWYQTNREKLKATKESLRTAVYNHYGSICACCGEREGRFLTIDHKNNDGSRQRKIHGTGLRLYKWIIDHDYPKDLQILCYNCNNGKKINHGKCPHQEFNVFKPGANHEVK